MNLDRNHAVYRVVGGRQYRGHDHGVEFVARLDRLSEARAVKRGDIVVLEHIVPSLPPVYAFPDGWLPRPPTVRPRRRREAPLSLKGVQ